MKIVNKRIYTDKAYIELLEDNRHYLNNKIDKAVKYLKKKLNEEEPVLVEYEIETLLDILKGEE